MLNGNAYLVAGGAEAVPALLAHLEKEGIRTRGNMDVYVRTYARFGADEARELQERARTRAVSDDRRVFIVASPSMTKEAQNALLKTLEEPLADALFFIVVPSPELLLATVRSRAQILELPERGAFEEIVPAKQFLAATPQKRLDMLKPLLEKGEDDPSGTGKASHGAGKRDIGAILGFLSSLERVLAERAAREGMKAIYHARKYVTDKGALVKPLLEEVALLTPHI